MKGRLVSLAKYVKPGSSIIAASMVTYALYSALVPTFISIVVVTGLGMLFGMLLVADSKAKQTEFKAACRHLWSLSPQQYDHACDGVMRDLMIQQFPDAAHGQCRGFAIDTSGFPGFEAQGYFMVDGSMLHLAVVAGVRGKWHIDSYCQATCTVQGSVFTIESICGPLTGWVGVGAKLGFSVEHDDDEGLRGGPFGHVQLFKCDVPRVLHRFVAAAGKTGCV